MGAPTPFSGPLPTLFTGSYLKRTPGVGNLYVGSYASSGAVGSGGTGTVFDDLVNPPASGVAAETASSEFARAVGSTSLTSPVHGKDFYSAATVTDMVKKNFDFVMNFYLTASIARDSSGVPIA